jgi:hypothetical protein
MELTIASALCARIAEAATVRTFRLHCQDRSIGGLRDINFVDDLDLFDVSDRILRAVTVPDEPCPEPGIVRLLRSSREHVAFAKAGRAAVVLNSGTVTTCANRPEMTGGATLFQLCFSNTVYHGGSFHSTLTQTVPISATRIDFQRPNRGRRNQCS